MILATILILLFFSIYCTKNMNIIDEIKDIKEKLNNLTRANQPSYSEYYRINEPMVAVGTPPSFSLKFANEYSTFNLKSILGVGDAIRWKESPTGQWKYGNIQRVFPFFINLIVNDNYSINSTTIYALEKAIVAKPTDFPSFFKYTATITPTVTGATFNVQNPNDNLSTRYTVVRGNILSVFVDINSAKINTSSNTSLKISLPAPHIAILQNSAIEYNQLGFCLNNNFHVFCSLKKLGLIDLLVTPYFPRFNNLNIYDPIIGFVDTGSNFSTSIGFTFTYSFF